TDRLQNSHNRIDGNNPGAEPYAVKLGVAMQLTNIIRDIKEDYSLGRIYLPREELERFGVTDQNIAQGDLNENMKALLRFAIDRARANYRECLPGIAMIQDRRCRFVIHIMKELYAGILDAVERNGLDVFSRRAYMSMFRKIAKTIQVALTWPFD
ncbi:MAG TPA: squalene/phytoene synthase family protein, partial [Candidatus Omnitrophota bacterium]|nr:squalene/phytoene synthase family protein [Candidatus Omnitrophota bacterium]